VTVPKITEIPVFCNDAENLLVASLSAIPARTGPEGQDRCQAFSVEQAAEAILGAPARLPPASGRYPTLAP
jgi:hypothetical protein